MPDDYRISDLTTAPSIGNSDLMELSVVNTSSESGYSSMKTPVTGLANKIVNGIQYVADLETTAKTITGAINELAQGGGGGGGDADVIKTASGAIASFETEFSAPLHSLKATINASGGGGTPDNPIPIVGFTELNVTRCGKQLWNEQYEVGQFNPSTGQPVSVSNAIRTKDDILIPSGTSFALLFPSGISGRIYYLDNNKTMVSTETIGSGVTVKTMPSGCCYLRFHTSTSYGETYNNDIAVLYPRTETQYVQYNGETITLDLNGTRYGGYVDVNNGKLVVTWGYKDLGTLNYTYDSDVPRFWTNEITDIKRPSTTAIVISGLADIYRVVSFDDLYYRYKENGTLACSTAGVVSIINTAYTDAQTFKTAMSGHYLAYELATPIEIDISPEHLDANVGQNNVFHDCNGETEVEYYTKTAGEIKQFIEDDVEVSDLAGVPDLPSTDGTYTLKVTITDGVPTFSWEAEA